MPTCPVCSKQVSDDSDAYIQELQEVEYLLHAACYGPFCEYLGRHADTHSGQCEDCFEPTCKYSRRFQDAVKELDEEKALCANLNCSLSDYRRWMKDVY